MQQEFRTTDELIAHYKAVRSRVNQWKRPPRKIEIAEPEPCAVAVDETPAEPPIEVSKVETVEQVTAAECAAMLQKSRIMKRAGRPYGYPTLTEVIDLVCLTYGVSKVDIVSQRRTKDIVMPRQIAAALAVLMTPHSLPTVGKHLGGRDHTTILHSVQKIKRMRSESPDFDAELSNLERKLGGHRPKKQTHGQVWQIPGFSERFVELVKTTRQPCEWIAYRLNHEFGTEVSYGACYARLYTLGLRGKRPKKRSPDYAVAA